MPSERRLVGRAAAHGPAALSALLEQRFESTAPTN